MKKFLFIYFLFISILGCSSDNDNSSTPANNSRNFKFEISGNYTGKSTIVYTSGNGSNSIEEASSLPWTKEITYDGSVQATTLVASPVVGNSGLEGQNLKLKVYRGGELIKESEVTVLSNGYFNLNIPAIML